MKITCNRAALLGACTAAGAAVGPTKGARPILANLLAVAAGDSVTLTGSDVDMAVRLELRGVQVQRPGEAVLSYGLLSQILKECQEPEVTIAATASGTSVLVGSSRFELPAWNVAEYPALPDLEERGHHEVTAGVLKALIKRVAFAIGKDTSRFTLQGVLWEAENNVVRLVATDSKVLAVAEAPAMKMGPAPDKKAGAHIVPKRAIGLLEKLLTDDAELVRVYLTGRAATFHTDRGLVYTQLLEGRYPPYRDIVGHTRKAAAYKIPLPTQGFLRAVRQAAVMAKDESCRVDVEFEPGGAVLQARGAEIGSSRVEMPLPGTDGVVKFSADPEYLSDLLRSFAPAGTSSLEVKSGQHPLLFRDGDGHQVILMPMAA